MLPFIFHIAYHIHKVLFSQTSLLDSIGRQIAGVTCVDPPPLSEIH